MSREELIAMARRTLAHARLGTMPRAAGRHAIPASRYTDPQRWQLEVERIHRRLPLAMALSADLPAPGSFETLDPTGIPILIVRGQDGRIRAFRNSCSHRGARLEDRASGTTKRFTCPYHAWSYDGEGALVGIFNEGDFGQVDRDCLGLTALPAAERAGVVFVSLNEEPSVEIDDFLVGYDAFLAHKGFSDLRPMRRITFPGPNWKIAFDGYLDFYHLPILHRKTFGDQFSSRAVYDAWGPHQRISAVPTEISSAYDGPEEDWPLGLISEGVYALYPGFALVSFPLGPGLVLYQFNQIFPADSVGVSSTTIRFYSNVEPDERQRKTIDEMIDLLIRVVTTEDIPACEGVQRSLQAGAPREVLFGLNESGGQRFHQWTDRLVAAESDAALADVFAKAEAFHPE